MENFAFDLIVHMWNKALAAITSKQTGWIFGSLSWIVTMLFGAGIIPTYKTHELDLATKTTELRRQENEQYAKLLIDFDAYVAALVKNESEWKIGRLKDQVDITKDDLDALEGKLAKLENREPRIYTLDLHQQTATKTFTMTVLPANQKPGAKHKSKKSAPSN